MGREAELNQLLGRLEKALQGERQVVFVTGEAGIGKTTLLEAFLDQIASREEVWIGQGQCIEQYGAGEAYLPVLEALGRLCREPRGGRLIELLHRQAPTWLVQMPSLLASTELEILQRKVLGATRERMLREMVEAVEALTQEHPLILRLEDLHWSDPSTLDLIAYLARRPGPARLLVVGTYRPVDVIVQEHPLKIVKQELQLHDQCAELRLEFLMEAAVEEYLTRRFGVGVQRAVRTQELVEMLHRRTEGNPLFMVAVVNDLVARGVVTQRDGQWELGGEIAAAEVPFGLQQFIGQQLERVSAGERQVLEAASVAGMDFSAAAVAAALEERVEGVEKRCEELARREQFVRAGGVSEWPDGTVAARYRFIHAVYQELVYDRVSVSQQIGFHQRIGERTETGYGERAREVAVELAVHFERGRDTQRAIQYLQQAGDNAIRRSAHQEAINLLTRGLELLKTQLIDLNRTQQEIILQTTLGVSLVATKGYGDSEVVRVYTRARELCQQVGETPQLFSALVGLWGFYLVRAEFQTARELGEQLLSIAQCQQDPALLLVAHRSLGMSLLVLGELAQAREHLGRGVTLYDPQKHGSQAFMYGQDLGVTCLCFEAFALWFLGHPAQARKKSLDAVSLARKLTHPFSLAFALIEGAILSWLRRESKATQEQVEEAMALSTGQGFPVWLAQGTIQQGWALSDQGQGEEGIRQMHRGLAAYRATGSEIARPGLLAMLAMAYARIEQIERGLNVVNEALEVVNTNGERFCEADLYRLKGELTLQSRGQSPEDRGKEAEEYFQQAIDIARRQEAKSLELRAVMSLSRLWQQQGKTAEARQMLAEIYNWFTEGFDTADLKEAKALLEQLT